jgi:hypothetical protein
MSEVWSKWQGSVVNGTLPLRRHLGGSDHSGVFLTELSGREPAEVAIKLVPATTGAQSQLLRWERSAGLSHPHLIRILETGRCQLGGRSFLFAVMEYADQNLAQLLEHRAMTAAEAREMLPPVLGALAFLHNRNLLQGQLKPANVLVVGDQIKLASDTIRAIGDTAAINMVSAYDPPELQDGIRSTAGDIWALGVTLFEALTRKPPLGLEVRPEGIALPADFPATFREIVTWCLSRRPYDRPKVAELDARLRGQVMATPPTANRPVALQRPPTTVRKQPAIVTPPPTLASRARMPVVPRATPVSKSNDTASPRPPSGVIEHVFRERSSPQRVVPHPAVAVPTAGSKATQKGAVAAPRVAEVSPAPHEAPRKSSVAAPMSREAASNSSVVAPILNEVARKPDAAAPMSREAERRSAAQQPTQPVLSPPETFAEELTGLRSVRLLLVLGTVAIVVLVWAGTRVYNAYWAPSLAVSDESVTRTSSVVVPAARETLPPPPPVSSTSKVKLHGSARPVAAEPSPPVLVNVHRELPDVPQHVLRTVRGHVRVSVRLIIGKDGTVFAALVDHPGPSRYFERAAIEAAKKWTFPATDTGASSRLELVRFDFTRSGTTANTDVIE